MLGVTVTNRNCIHKEIKRKLNSGNYCYHSVQNLEKMKMYKTIVFPLNLQECETWFLTLREENRLRVFENKMLRRIFGPKRDEVTGGWKKLHNEEFRDVYSLPGIIRIMKARRMILAGHVARMREKTKAYSSLVGKPEGERPLRRPRRR
jgi:hypothetical protein